MTSARAYNLLHRGELNEKSFSQRRSNFPSRRAEQGAGELHAHQLVAVGGTNVDYTRLQAAHGAGYLGGVGEGGTGYFQGNPGGERQSTGYGQQNAAGAQVQCGGKFEKFFAPIISGPHKHRNSQGQSFPISSVFHNSFAGHGFVGLANKPFSVAPKLPKPTSPCG